MLFVIAHCFHPFGRGPYGSHQKDPQPRMMALTACLSSLREVFGGPQYLIRHGSRTAVKVNQKQRGVVDIVVCTTGAFHLLDQIPLPKDYYRHHKVGCDPMKLGFEAQAVLRENCGRYDYYCFLEDDLVLQDPLFFQKLQWFTKAFGKECLLQPHRYELSPLGPVRKVYLDGDLAPAMTALFQNGQEAPDRIATVLGEELRFCRAGNPHSGCYFLNAAQMEFWVKQRHFLDRDMSFIGPLESAATLGIAKTFPVYKPALENANFLEILHFGRGYLNKTGKEFAIVK